MSFDISQFLTGQPSQTPTRRTRFDDWLKNDLFGGIDPYKGIPGIQLGWLGEAPGIPGPLSGVDPSYVEALVGAFSGDITKEQLIAYAQDPMLQASYDSSGVSGLKESLKDRGVAFKEPSAPRDTVRDQAIREVLGLTPLQYEERQLREAEEAKFKQDHTKTYSLWETYFGAEPTAAQILDVEAHGSDFQQWTDYVRAMPSHLPGINIGAYTDLKKSMDSASQQRFGYAANDTQIQEAYNFDYRSAAGIQYYFDEQFNNHGVTAIPQVQNMLWKSANDMTQAIWNQTPMPADVHAMWVAAGSPGQVSPQQSMEMGKSTPATSPAPAPTTPPRLARPDVDDGNTK